MRSPLSPIGLALLLALLSVQDAFAARRSIRVEFSAWSDAYALGSENCPGSFAEGQDLTWNGIVFSGALGPWYLEDAYCQVAFQKEFPSDPAYAYLSNESFPADEAGLAELIGPNDSDDPEQRVTAVRYTYLDQDRFSDDPEPDGYQWAFYFFPGDITLVAFYTTFSNSGPTIHDSGGTVWDAASDGFDGEYFCFEGRNFIGTWDGEPHDGGEYSSCEFLISDRVFAGGFEAPQPENRVFFPAASGSDVEEVFSSSGVILADVDGANGPDLLAAQFFELRLYLNNGGVDPFAGVEGSTVEAIGPYPTALSTIATGEMDGSNGPDVVLGVSSLTLDGGAQMLLKLNNGTAEPFSGVAGLPIGAAARRTSAVGLADVDGVNGPDVVEASYGEALRLFLNNGGADPFAAVTGTDIGVPGADVRDVVLGDLNGDDHPDLVAPAWSGPNMLYLNNGTADPFNGVIGIPLAGEFRGRIAALGDLDGDGHLDLVFAGSGSDGSRILLNNGTSAPFEGVTAYAFAPESASRRELGLADVDNDGDLDIVMTTNDATRLYLNRGGATPLAGARGLIIAPDFPEAWSLATGDVNGDGKTDIALGAGQIPLLRLYLND